ncbi:MAG: glycosyltransferase [Polyangiaceae bacterium]|nr:glycosyltransferase [Polyangiaceae bacterium]
MSVSAYEVLGGTRFLLWGFPEPTQTFIHREMLEMARRGLPVRLVAVRRRAVDPGPELSPLLHRTLWLGHPVLTATRGSARGLRSGWRFRRAIDRMLALPHRSPWHRLRGLAMVSLAADIAPRLEQEGTRYLHAHFGAYQAELAMALAWLLEIPFGVTFHAVDIWSDANALGSKIAAASVALTCTENNARHLRQEAGPHANRVHLVRHGLDLTRLPAVAPLPPAERPRWLAVGRLVKKKGFVHLIDAVELLRRRGKKVQVTILGDGPERAALERRTRTLGLQGQVDLPGHAPSRPVWDELRRSRGLVAPSVRAADGNVDGIPNVILEAMAMARPVVASELSGIPEVVLPGETGLLVRPGDASGLADALEELSSADERAAPMGRAGRDLVFAEYDVRKNTARQIELLANAAL